MDDLEKQQGTQGLPQTVLISIFVKFTNFVIIDLKKK